MHRLLALVLFVIALLAGWKVYSAITIADQASAAVPLAAKAGTKICFVQLGDFPVEQLESLKSYYQGKFGIEISISKSVPVGSEMWDPSRGQLRAEDLAASLRPALPQYDRNTILIGFTSDDIYPVSQGWRFAFGWRTPATGSAVVSTARLGLPDEGEPADAQISATRLRKIVTKDIGIFYFGLPQSSNPKSVLYKKIMGIEELDNVGEDF